MAYKQGARVKVAHHTPHMSAGSHGTIHSVHHGTMYGINHGGGVVFMPAAMVNDPDHDGDNDAPGGGDTDSDAPAGHASAEVASAVADIMASRRGKLRQG